MKRDALFFITLIIAPVMLSGCRSAGPSVPHRGPGTDVLEQHARELNDAFRDGDLRKLRSFFAPDYYFFFTDHNVSGSLQTMPNAPRGRYSAKFLEKLSGGFQAYNIVDVRVYGDFGVVVAHYEWRGSFMGESFDYQGHITDVWVRREDRWWILSSSASLLPPFH